MRNIAEVPVKEHSNIEVKEAKAKYINNMDGYYVFKEVDNVC